MISVGLQRAKYVVGDFVSSTLAWFAYTYLRFYLNQDIVYNQGFHDFYTYLTSMYVALGMVVFPLMMMGVYYLSGYYNEVFRKSRLQEFFVTLSCALVNSLIIFFVALVNDMANDRTYNYEMLFLLVLLLFVIVYFVRSIITQRSSHKIKRRIWQFNTLIIGTGAEAVRMGDNLNSMPESVGYNVVGYVKVPAEKVGLDSMGLPVYSLDEIESVCRTCDIKELIVSLTDCPAEKVLDTINKLFGLNLPIKITPTISDIVLTHTTVQQLVGDPLVDVSGCSMGDCERNIKWFCDVVVSAIALVILAPFFAALAIAIKVDSKGPVVYRQRRIGLHNKPFTIYKFRSMVADAEKDDTPQLSADDDNRVTKVGRWMRKYRIDETLQFWNVLKGDMSLVGPRPEREFYLNQMMARVPYCALLHQVRPGVTSLGMVKYGYAKNVDEMIERLKYDLLYLENMSLVNDIKILIYTVKIVINGRGI
ncbi:MAG: sugar transferase [Muribaculaceae bacterium]